MMLLGGCYTAREAADTVPTDYRLRHPISIQEGEKSVALMIGNRRGTLTPAQRTDTVALAGVWKREATGGIIVDVPAGGANGRSAAEAAREVKSLLVASGVPEHLVRVRPYPAPETKFAPLKIKYTRVTADAGPCGLWPKDLGPEGDPLWFENRPYWNLGCATQRNLAAMVDNPADLVQPREEGPIYAGRRSVVLDKYRRGESTAAVDPNAEKAKISEIGQ